MPEVVIPKPLGNKLYIQILYQPDRLRHYSLKRRNQSSARKTHTFETVMAGLRSHRNPKNIAGMARFGISTKNTYGISVSVLRATAKAIRKGHRPSGKMWSSGVY